MFILPVMRDHLSWETTKLSGRFIQASLYQQPWHCPWPNLPGIFWFQHKKGWNKCLTMKKDIWVLRWPIARTLTAEFSGFVGGLNSVVVARLKSPAKQKRFIKTSTHTPINYVMIDLGNGLVPSGAKKRVDSIRNWTNWGTLDQNGRHFVDNIFSVFSRKKILYLFQFFAEICSKLLTWQ